MDRGLPLTSRMVQDGPGWRRPPRWEYHKTCFRRKLNRPRVIVLAAAVTLTAHSLLLTEHPGRTPRSWWRGWGRRWGRRWGRPALRGPGRRHCRRPRCRRQSRAGTAGAAGGRRWLPQLRWRRTARTGRTARRRLRTAATARITEASASSCSPRRPGWGSAPARTRPPR